MEPSTQKNAVPRKHGMQILGKVPSARRPPANLPSLKAETSTPTTTEQGGSWASSSAETGSTQNQPNSVLATQSVTAGDKLVQNDTVKSTNNTAATQQSNFFFLLFSHFDLQFSCILFCIKDSSSNQSWSSVATGTQVETPQPPLYQSPQFQHEFPSLDGSGASTQIKG